MSSPLTNSPDVKSIVDAIAARNVSWLESLRAQRVPSPSHLMFACATVLGDQEQVAEFMKGVAGRDKRDRFIDLAIKLAQADDAPVQEVQEVQAAHEAPFEVVSTDAPTDDGDVADDADAPKRRRRRTAAEMAAARQQQAGGSDAPTAELLSDVMDVVREIAKAVYALDTRLIELAGRIDALNSLCHQNASNVSNLGDTVVAHCVQTESVKARLDLIRDALSAAELELVTSGKLDSAAMSDVMDASWPNN